MSFSGSPFGDVIEWFLGRAGDRRHYRRRPGAFHLWWLPDASNAENRKQGVGLELSPNGVMFMIAEKIDRREFSVVMRVRDTNIPARIKHVRSDTVEHQGKTWHRYMGEFVGIAADHWDAIVRYVNDVPEPVDRRKMQHAEMGEKVDDAYRLLPLAIQERIVAMLVDEGKLEPPKAGQTPLLKLFYGGLVKRPGAKEAHRFNVHSRVYREGEAMAYDTRLLVDEDGEVTVL